MSPLNELGWGAKRIARELGVSRNTVKDYIAAGGWTPYRQPARKKVLDGLEGWLRERLRRHRGNADVIRQELASEKGIIASLRTVERAVKPYRQELEAEARATARFETAAGKQMQIDFGERLVEIGGNRVRTYLFVATLGYSRRHHVRAFRNERQESWFDGLESAFAKFGGVTRRSYSTTRGPWWSITIQQRARWCSTTSLRHSPSTGASGRGPARHTAPALRERLRTASAT